MLNTNQTLVLASILVAMLTSLANWVGLRGGGMKRLNLAAGIGRSISNLDEPEKSLLKSRFYGLLAQEHYPSRRMRSLLIVLVWYASISSLALVGIISSVGRTGWILILLAVLAATLIAKDSLQKFGQNSTPMLLRNEILQRQQAAADHFLNITGNLPDDYDDLNKRLKRRELYLRWVQPVVDAVTRLVDRHTWIKPTRDTLMILILLYFMGGLAGFWPLPT